MSSFEETIIEVWRQALVENTKTAKLGAESYPVRRAGAVLGLAVVGVAFAFASTTLRHEWTFWIAVLVLFVAPNFYAKFRRPKPMKPENYHFT